MTGWGRGPRARSGLVALTSCRELVCVWHRTVSGRPCQQIILTHPPCHPDTHQAVAVSSASWRLSISSPATQTDPTRHRALYFTESHFRCAPVPMRLCIVSSQAIEKKNVKIYLLTKDNVINKTVLLNTHTHTHLLTVSCNVNDCKHFDTDDDR